jgi:TonB family protein
MESFDTEELSDQELSQMLAAWTVPVPTERLRTKIFAMVPVVRPQPTFTVGNIWSGFAERRKRNLAFGLLIQAAAVASLFLLVQPAGHMVKKTDQIILLDPYQPKVPAVQKAGGGGGGGQRDKTAAAKGAAPQFARKQFMPPAVAMVQPKLAVVPTLTAPAPSIVAENYDDPLSKLTENSGGQGINGFGDGKGGGIGKGNGDGLGNGEGSGSGGGIYRAGGEVSSPQLISKVEPEYSEEARKAKYSGVVHLSVVIDEHGIPTDIRVTGPLGLGLDEKAVEAVQHWRFRPGMRNGKAVKVRAMVEVSFRLL